ncbi:MAG TPA: chemotaxis protein CheW [Thermoanaerobaculia bacterium]
MVDLVKIRKKAKQKKESQVAGRGSQETSAQPTTSNQQPATPPTPTTPRSRLERFLETAGQRRATRTTAESETQTPQIELLTFVLAHEQYAIPIDDVGEIVIPRPITRVPNADPSIVGILSLRGAIVTLIDVRGLLGHPSAVTAADEDSRIIVVHHGGEDVGFVVDGVNRVVKVDADAIEAHPVVHASEHDESVRGVFRHDGALAILLDLEKLFGGVPAWS